MAPWLPAMAWAALLFFVSSLSSIPGPGISSFDDKLAHFGVYLVLGALLAFAVDRTGWPLWTAALLGVLYGASDEVHQLFVPGRSASVVDWIADAAGVCTAVFLFARIRARRMAAARRRSPDPSALRA